MTSVTDQPAPPAPHPALAWAVFLGTSWTWCIGMFLPVLLVRDLGPAAFLIFAIPNVLGAAAMGFVLQQGSSERTVERHRTACVAFSAVTILFHLYFAGWILSALLGPIPGTLVILLAGVLWWLGRLRPGRDVTVAIATYLASLVCVGLFLAYGRPGLPTAQLHVPGAPTKLIGLLAVCVFGFTLCPYLDLTFHRARQETDERGARVAFAAGFGAFFLFMILFTLCYTGPMTAFLRGAALGLAGTVLGVHLLVQSGFTISAHLREIAAARSHGMDAVRLAMLLVGGGLIIAGVHAVTEQNLASGEVPYLFFMGAYGLIFPAYAFSWMLPNSRPRPALVIAGILLALPFFYVGFIQRQMLLLIPGVLLAMLPRVLQRRESAATAAPVTQ